MVTCVNFNKTKMTYCVSVKESVIKDFDMSVLIYNQQALNKLVIVDHHATVKAS